MRILFFKITFGEFVAVFILHDSELQKDEFLVRFFFLERHLHVTSWHVYCYALPGTWRAHNVPCMLWAQCIAPGEKAIPQEITDILVNSWLPKYHATWEIDYLLLATYAIVNLYCYYDDSIQHMFWGICNLSEELLEYNMLF